MWQNLEQSLTRYRELEGQMADPAVIADRNRYTHAAKEHGALAKLVKPYLEYRKISEDVSHAEALAAAENDPASTTRTNISMAARRIITKPSRRAI